MWLSIKRWLIGKLMAWLLPEDAAKQREWLAAYEREQKIIAEVNDSIRARADEIKATEARAEERDHRILEIEHEDPKAIVDRLSDDDVLRAPLRRSDR